eukprot:CAMPEP_0175043608 /NCGR_PEP_ID=MMETSP0052_2-20121109/3296_1 /TAXON_ID=51329 ORGANISM="Polytomella parva, Strain SAG 63-3" /NCGR_SAMPLE_ID=MMETSP0052_2 /ASSEMBLY_ACC=CAM_ASM_000194 /LENGTH=454 /DNA_ID=CAMNT_0016306715 /DNA_START=480 /DNA_END=1844 /DNA_ORIENTATION=+
MSRHSGATKNHIISVLREHSPSLRYLFPLVKSIFKVHFLNCSFGQSFSSYCLLLLTIAFLQEKGRLPPLWKLFFDKEPQRYDARILDKNPDLSREEVVDLMRGRLSGFDAPSEPRKDLLVDFLDYLKARLSHVSDPKSLQTTATAICPLLGQRLPVWRGSAGQSYLVVEDPFASLSNSNVSSRDNPLDNAARTFAKRADGESSVYFVYNRIRYLHYILQRSVYSLYSLDSCGASLFVKDKTICPDSNGRNLIWLAMLLFGPTQLKMVRKIMFAKFESNPLSNWENDFKEKLKKFIALLDELLNTVLTVMNPELPCRNFSERNAKTSSLAQFALIHFWATKSLWHYVITKFNPNHSVSELDQVITSNPSMPIITTWFDWSTNKINVNTSLEAMFRIDAPNLMNEATDMIFQSLSSEALPFHDRGKKSHQSVRSIWEFFAPNDSIIIYEPSMDQSL